MDIGGPPYLIPLVDRSKVYDLSKIVPAYAGSKGYPKGWYISGAAAGPWPVMGSNCEMVVSMMLGKEGNIEINKSKVALTSNCSISCDSKDQMDDVTLKNLSLQESRCALLANLMVSSGLPGKVLDIKCKRRIDPKTNFTTALRSALSKQFGNDPIGLGGLFLVKQAHSKIHIMPDFSTDPLMSEDEVNNWLRFFEMEPPMLFQSVVVSTDPGLDLRVEHSHGWSLNGKSEGGHYHYDLSPETVEYQGYYAVADKLLRIDRPKTTHQLGR